MDMGLGSIEIGSLDPINTLPFDHKSGTPDSQLRLLPDINKPPVDTKSTCALYSLLRGAGLPPEAMQPAHVEQLACVPSGLVVS
jgi:hypothetical protein